MSIKGKPFLFQRFLSTLLILSVGIGLPGSAYALRPQLGMEELNEALPSFAAGAEELPREVRENVRLMIRGVPNAGASVVDWIFESDDDAIRARRFVETLSASGFGQQEMNASELGNLRQFCYDSLRTDVLDLDRSDSILVYAVYAMLDDFEYIFEPEKAIHLRHSFAQAETSLADGHFRVATQLYHKAIQEAGAINSVLDALLNNPSIPDYYKLGLRGFRDEANVVIGEARGRLQSIQLNNPEDAAATVAMDVKIDSERILRLIRKSLDHPYTSGVLQVGIVEAEGEDEVHTYNGTWTNGECSVVLELIGQDETPPNLRLHLEVTIHNFHFPPGTTVKWPEFHVRTPDGLIDQPIYIQTLDPRKTKVQRLQGAGSFRIPRTTSSTHFQVRLAGQEESSIGLEDAVVQLQEPLLVDTEQPEPVPDVLYDKADIVRSEQPVYVAFWDGRLPMIGQVTLVNAESSEFVFQPEQSDPGGLHVFSFDKVRDFKVVGSKRIHYLKEQLMHAKLSGSSIQLKWFDGETVEKTVQGKVALITQDSVSINPAEDAQRKVLLSEVLAVAGLEEKIVRVVTVNRLARTGHPIAVRNPKAMESLRDAKVSRVALLPAVPNTQEIPSSTRLIVDYETLAENSPVPEKMIELKERFSARDQVHYVLNPENLDRQLRDDSARSDREQRIFLFGATAEDDEAKATLTKKFKEINPEHAALIFVNPETLNLDAVHVALAHAKSLRGQVLDWTVHPPLLLSESDKHETWVFA